MGIATLGGVIAVGGDCLGSSKLFTLASPHRRHGHLIKSNIEVKSSWICVPWHELVRKPCSETEQGASRIEKLFIFFLNTSKWLLEWLEVWRLTQSTVQNAWEVWRLAEWVSETWKCSSAQICRCLWGSSCVKIRHSAWILGWSMLRPIFFVVAEWPSFCFNKIEETTIGKKCNLEKLSFTLYTIFCNTFVMQLYYVLCIGFSVICYLPAWTFANACDLSNLEG